ncbi:MAG: Hsp33 family molecular chaperone [Caulobacteraceae bacterium]|nr:Hsp33 family molecular chaperone [Caulobacteraceae bacterium]
MASPFPPPGFESSVIAQNPYLGAMTDIPLLQDDFVAPFSLEGSGGEPSTVRGRVARLGAAIDQVLTGHAYPAPVANLLGEACALAALVGSSMKFEGRLILQAQGDGPVSFVVCDYDTAGQLRGYCSYNAARLAELGAAASARDLLGGGLFVMTIDRGPDMDRYQGVTPIEGDSLAQAAEAYFAQSEQVPTRIRLAVGQIDQGAGLHWRAGGMLIQSVASDAARGDTSDAWDKAQALFGTIRPDELIDPTVSAPTLLFRLFHEDGARLFAPTPLVAQCRCSADRIGALLASFSPEERAGMVEADGKVRVTCEYCSRQYELEDSGAQEAHAAG